MNRSRRFRLSPVLAAALVLGFAAPAAAFQLQDTDGNIGGTPQGFDDNGSAAPAGPNHRAFFGDRKTTLDGGNFSVQMGPQNSYRNYGQNFNFNAQFNQYDPFGAQNR